MAVLVASKNQEDQSKKKALYWSKRFSHYKFMGIFPAAQGQLTPQAIVGYG